MSKKLDPYISRILNVKDPGLYIHLNNDILLIGTALVRKLSDIVIAIKTMRYRLLMNQWIRKATKTFGAFYIHLNNEIKSMN